MDKASNQEFFAAILSSNILVPFLEQNPELAARRLAILGSDPPAQYVSGTIEYAQANGFTPDEMTLLQGLLTAMQTYQPAGDGT